MRKIVVFLVTFMMCFSGTAAFAATGPATDMPAGTESALAAEDPQYGDRANSWRYENGNPVESLEKSARAVPSDPNATLKGIDVSKHNGKIDWEKVKATGEVDFVIIRCGYGLDRYEWDDAWFEYNASECERLGIPYGVYIYSYANDVEDAESEALHTLRLIKGHTLSYPVYYDLEDNSSLVGSSTKQNRANLKSFAETFCSIIEGEGYPVGVYASYYWWTTYLTDDVFDQWHRWVARYNDFCGYDKDYAIWQYTSDGNVDGIYNANGTLARVDMNYQIGNPDGHNIEQQIGNTQAAENMGRLFTSDSNIRVYGQDRYLTAEAAAEALKKSKGISKFENIIVASGKDYPDALTGSYLAKVKDAPILLVKNSVEADVVSYINNNLKEGGSVYILGGTAAVSDIFQKKLLTSLGDKASIKRLAGKDRYETNIAILKAAGVKDEDLLVCTGKNYADSLSASASGKPILLVGKKISAAQEAYLKTLNTDKIYIIGGDSAVNTDVEKACKKFASVARVYGEDRYKTSVEVAKKFFRYRSNAAVLAYGKNFPDGLTGGPLALALDAPLLLITDKAYSDAAGYAEAAKINNSVTMGGSALISEKTIADMFK